MATSGTRDEMRGLSFYGLISFKEDAGADYDGKYFTLKDGNGITVTFTASSFFGSGGTRVSATSYTFGTNSLDKEGVTTSFANTVNLARDNGDLTITAILIPSPLDMNLLLVQNIVTIPSGIAATEIGGDLNDWFGPSTFTAIVEGFHDISNSMDPITSNDQAAQLLLMLRAGVRWPGNNLYIKPRCAISPDFTLHHYNMDHTAANFDFYSQPHEKGYNMLAQNSLVFNGTSDFVKIDNDELDWHSGTSTRSWSLWFKRDGAPSNLEFLLIHGDSDSSGGTEDGMLLKIGAAPGNLGTCAPQVHQSFTTYASDAEYIDDEWHHAVVVIDAGQRSLYVDGELIIGPDTLTYSGDFSGPIYLGRRNDGSGNYFEGLLTDFSHWAKALSSDEVAELYAGGKLFNLLAHAAAADLKLWWRLGFDVERHLGEVFDYSGNGYHGEQGGPDLPDIPDSPPLYTRLVRRQVPFSKRFQLIRGAGSGRTTTG